MDVTTFSPVAIAYGVALVPVGFALKKLVPKMLPVQMPGWLMPWIMLLMSILMVVGWPREIVWGLAQIIMHSIITWVVAMGVWSGAKAAIGK